MSDNQFDTLMQDKANHPVKSLKKSIDIIEELKMLRSATLSDVADGVEMNKSVVHNHLSTLQEHGYVTKDGKKYRLSFKFLNIGGCMRYETNIYTVAKPKVDELAEETGELVTLATQELGRGVVLYRSKGEQAVEIDTHVGRRVSLHNSGLGKAILAHMPEDKVHEIIDTYGLEPQTSNTITNQEILLEELKEIREAGHAIDDEEQWRGLQCVAAPILMEDETIKGAISISAPKSRIEDEEIKEGYIDKAKNAANIIELSLTYS